MPENGEVGLTDSSNRSRATTKDLQPKDDDESTPGSSNKTSRQSMLRVLNPIIAILLCLVPVTMITLGAFAPLHHWYFGLPDGYSLFSVVSYLGAILSPAVSATVAAWIVVRAFDGLGRRIIYGSLLCVLITSLLLITAFAGCQVIAKARGYGWRPDDTLGGQVTTSK